jgi:hypothetical protein
MSKAFTLLLLLICHCAKAQLPNYIPILVDDKYGFCDSNMNMLVAPGYKSVKPLHQHYLVKENKQYFLLNAATGKKTSNFDTYLDVNTYTKYVNPGTYISMWFTVEKEITSLYWFKISKHFFAAITTDTLLIFNNDLDLVGSTIINKKKKSSHRVLLLDDVKHTFFYEQSVKGNIVEAQILNSGNTVCNYLFSKKDTAAVYPIGNNYFSECINKQCALLKINGDEIDTLTGHKYYLIELDTISNTFKAVIDKDVDFDSLDNLVFNKIKYLDTNGKEFYSYETPVEMSIKNEPKLQKSVHNFSTLLFSSPIVDNKLLLFTTPFGFSSLYRVESLPMPATFDTMFKKMFVVTRRIGTNYLVSISTWDSINRQPISKYGLISNDAVFLMPLKYSKIEIVADSLLIYRDSTHTGIANSNGKILFNTEIKADTFTHIWQQQYGFFSLAYIVPQQNGRGYDSTVCFLLKNETFTEITKYQIDSIYIANKFRTYEPNTLWKLGLDSLKSYYARNSKRYPYYKMKCKLIDSNQKTIFRNITPPFTRSEFYNNLFFVRKGWNKKATYIFYDRKGMIFYKLR